MKQTHTCVESVLVCSECSERLLARLPPGHHEEGVASVEAEAAGALPPPARRGQALPRELRQQPLRGSLALLLPVPGTGQQAS